MTTKDYLDEYAELWEVQHKGSEDTVERNYRKLEELAKELEASIRKEVVEQYVREGYCEGMLDARDTGGSAIKVGEVRSGKQTPVSLRMKVEELSKGIDIK